MQMNRKLAGLVATAAIVLTACSNSGSSAAPSTGASAAASGASAAGCKVGVSWNNYTEERWAKWDEPAIKAALAAAGAEYISNDAKSSAETQATNIDKLISQGAKVLIVLAQDGTAIKTSVAKRDRSGHPGHRLRPTDRGPQGPLHHVRQQGCRQDAGRGGLRRPSRRATTSIIKGNKADANADFLRSGMTEAGIR